MRNRLQPAEVKKTNPLLSKYQRDRVLSALGFLRFLGLSWDLIFIMGLLRNLGLSWDFFAQIQKNIFSSIFCQFAANFRHSRHVIFKTMVDNLKAIIAISGKVTFKILESPRENIMGFLKIYHGKPGNIMGFFSNKMLRTMLIAIIFSVTCVTIPA